jgi:PAS domain S-box-containing protein
LLAAIVESSDDAIISKNLDGVITSWNKGAERLFGYTPEEAIGQSIMLIIPADRRDEEKGIIDRIRRGERVEHFETVRVRKDGNTVDIALTISPVRDAGDRVIGASKVARDITERKRAENALCQSEARFRILSEKLESEVHARTKELEERNTDVVRQSEQLRELSWQLLRTRDQERRHIARELHDSTSQSLALLNMNLSSLRKVSSGGNEEVRKKIEECSSLAADVTSQIRTVSYLLHPPLLDELGLSSALKWFVEGFEQRSQVSVTLDIANEFGRLQPDLEIVLFRIVQESLANIHRHANCKSAFIRVSHKADGVSIEIQDDGSGIPSEKLAELRTQGSGVGIAGMRERVRKFDGALDIHSDKKGTKISVTIPATAIQARGAAG